MVGSEEGEEKLRVVRLEEGKTVGLISQSRVAEGHSAAYLPAPKPVSRLESEGGLVLRIIVRARRLTEVLDVLTRVLQRERCQEGRETL
jgi:hypothetical protein